MNLLQSIRRHHTDINKFLTLLEVPERKALTANMLGIPEAYGRSVLFRMGYRNSEGICNTIGLISSQRKAIEMLASTDRWGPPLPDTLRNVPSLLWTEI